MEGFPDLSMEEIIYKFNLAVKKVRGKDEFEVYKNYINDADVANIPCFFFIVFELGGLKRKSDDKASCTRFEGNIAYKLKDYDESLRLYTKSLRYANYNSEEYGLALANRSAVLFALEDYKSSIDDINLCLNANYPGHLKPKVYIRKAKCFQKLGETGDMRKTLLVLLNFLDRSPALLKSSSQTEKYRNIVRNLITSSKENNSDPEDKFDLLPPLNANPTFLNASSLVTLKYNKKRGLHVVAKEEIVQGDVLFVEKAYAFAPLDECSHPKKYHPLHCQYCLTKIASSVPCKSCVKFLYCNNKCRDAAWEEFHQWECVGIQGGFFKIVENGHLALRVILKGILNGISMGTIHFEDGITAYGNKDNNYPYVYNMSSYFHKVKKSNLLEYVVTAALVVAYLKWRTNFFEWMKQLPAYANKSYKELMNKLGGLMVRHSLQFHHHNVPVRVFDNKPLPSVAHIAVTVCPSMAAMAHSCMPNTAYHFVGDAVVVKATKNIKINEDVSYGLGGLPFILMDKDDRQSVLEKVYYLKCTCPICSDPKLDTGDAYQCVKCKGPAPLLDVHFLFSSKQCACLNCNYKFTLPLEMTIRERLVYELFRRFCQFEDPDDGYRCLEMSKTVFTSNHSIFNELYTKLLKYYKEKGEAKCFIKFGKMLIDYYEKKYFKVSVQLGKIYYTVCTCILEILHETAINMNANDLGNVLKELTNLVEKTKKIFSFIYPQFGTRLRKVEKSIFKLRILHAVQIANRKVYNLF